VIISKPAQLKRDHFSLRIDQEETVHVPFEDIAVIVLHHRQITLTHPVLAACAEYGISLFSTDDAHHPNGVFLPYLQHTRATKLLRLQMQLSRPFTKQLWAKIIQRKIENQAICLALNHQDGVEELKRFARRLRSGDPDNLEAQASAYYFPRLFWQGFYRSQDNWVNASLNYGYSILRGTIARGLVAHGLFPSLGIFHASEQNAFNLADDIIEPFRPLVDLHVTQQLKRNHGQIPDEFSTYDKAELVQLLHIDIKMPRGMMSVLSAIEQVVESLVRCYESDELNGLELPIITGLALHQLRE
jgi:CRISPR-associated protein Cas1